MTNIKPGQVHREVANVIKERNELRILTKYQSQAITQLGRQLDFYESLLISTQYELKSHRTSGSKNKAADDGIWIGTWLSTKRDGSVLSPAEKAWSKREHQRAIAMLDVIILGKHAETDETKIQAKLLKAIVERDCGLTREALAESGQALKIATEKQHYDLTGIAQFQRGVCFFHLEEYAEASLCFSLAAYTRNYREEVRVWKQMAEEMRLSYPTGDERRYITQSFKVS